VSVVEQGSHSLWMIGAITTGSSVMLRLLKVQSTGLSSRHGQNGDRDEASTHYYTRRELRSFASFSKGLVDATWTCARFMTTFYRVFDKILTTLV
jgi:hypothetical protein